MIGASWAELGFRWPPAEDSATPGWTGHHKLRTMVNGWARVCGGDGVVRERKIKDEDPGPDGLGNYP